ncbi:MAG: MaoC family dehydratase N-terminal domain-containing protein [Halioglobus sp.]
MEDTLDIQALTGERKGPYNSFNAVSRVQVWQWCSAMGDNNPLYLDDAYRSAVGIDRLVAPPAMMQMWTMRDVKDNYAPGSTDARPYEVFDVLKAHGVLGNVAVSYDITFHRLLEEGDRSHHYTTISNISDLKTTALGQGYFVTERVEYLDQNEKLFAEAFITYFQYTPAATENETAEQPASEAQQPKQKNAAPTAAEDWQPQFGDIAYSTLSEGDALPELAIPITHKLIVSAAIATQDFIDVHHNAPAAREAAMPDIFMNILTTSGLCARYLSDWAGPASRLRKLSFKLLAPNTPGDTMVMQGRVTALENNNEPLAKVEFAGKNSLGFHVTGAATLALSE